VKSFKQFFLEYRHNLADGTPAPSLQAHNGKNPNRVQPGKSLATRGEYKKDNPKMNVPGSLLSPVELADMGIEYEHGKILQNVKNSGFGIEMVSIGGKPMGRVFKSNK
jgi:hypothetical protein